MSTPAAPSLDKLRADLAGFEEIIKATTAEIAAKTEQLARCRGAHAYLASLLKAAEATPSAPTPATPDQTAK